MKRPTRIHLIGVVFAFAALSQLSLILENEAFGGTVSSRAPQGLKLADGHLIGWGETMEDVAKSALTHLYCYGGEHYCYADQDPNLPGPFSNAHLSFNDSDKLYEVHLRTGSGNFETVESELTSALAQKPHQQKSILQNGFGARFDQIIDLWRVDHVGLLLEKQDPETPGVTDLMIRYFPLTPQDQLEVKHNSVPF